MIKPRRKRLLSGFWPVPVTANRTLLAPGWLALAAALIAALVMPQQSPFPYHFDKGQPWNYPDLKAPFDFEVLFPEDQVREQLDAINTQHAPYFAVHPEIARQQKQRFAELIKEQTRISRNDTQFEDLVRNSANYQNYGQQMLSILYDKGIGGPELSALRRDDPNAAIYLVSGANEQRVPVSGLFTRESAIDFLTDTLPYSPLRQPEMLLPILEKTLAPNVLYSDSLTAAGKRRKIAAVVSTGITVRKNEVIVKKGELVTDEVFRKLDSLSGRYEAPKGWQVVAGYFLLAFSAFLMFFLWLKKDHAALWENREALLLAPVLVLFLLLLLSLSSWIGPEVTLLVPLWGVPRLLGRALGEDLGWVSWSLLMVLSTVSMDWSAGWLSIQMAGLAGVQFFQSAAANWTVRAGRTLFVVLLQSVIWQACILAGKLPAGLQITDVVLFLLVANALFLLVLPLSRALEQAVNQPG